MLWTTINCLDTEIVGAIVSVAVIVQIGSIATIMCGLLANAKKVNTFRHIFSCYNNGTGWDNQAYVVTLGILYALYSFSGV